VEPQLAAQRYLQRPPEAQALWRALLAAEPGAAHRWGEELRALRDELGNAGG
jgi:hypothetical protein